MFAKLSLDQMKILIPFFFIILFLIGQIAVPGCANMIPPEGGLRDTLPPKLLKATPADSSRNFNDNRLNFVFDEFVDLNNVQQNLLISPIPKVFPVVEYKLRTITVKLKDSLEANTTYTFNFANAIKDVNEGNLLKDLVYVFSTGPSLDSLTISGNVILAENGKIDTTLVVILHKNGADSAVQREKPRYATRLNSTGGFTFKNLPPGKFFIYALKDEGGSYLYQPGKQLFAFADSAVIAGSSKPVTLYAYSEAEPTLPQQQPARNNNRTSGNVENRLRPVPNTLSGPLDLFENFKLSFEQPLKTLDTSLVKLTADTMFTPVTGQHITLDSTKKKIIISNKWKENTRYNVILDKNFAEDTSGNKLLKTDTLVFITKKLSDYGSLKLRFRNLDLSTNPVLLIMQGENIIKSVSLTGPEVSIPLMNAGSYELRILQDRNKNGKWDPGDFFGKHLQPEIVKPVTSRPNITIKANWDNDFDIQL
jgi:uncharacterized protein (DUF2141 family)